MKLKLLFFIGILSVLFNTMNGQNTAPVFQVPPLNRTDCPGYTAANIQFQVTDANTPASLLVVTASAVGAQAVNFNYTQDPTGILRAVDVIPVGPIIPGVVTVTLTLSDVGLPLPNLSTTAVFTVNFEDITDPIISTTLPLPDILENISATAGCKFTVPDYTSLISATDYCGGVTITQSPAAGTELSVAHNDVVTITITATDDYGNDVSTSFDVTLEDVDNPSISAVTDFDVNINATDCDFTIPDYTSFVTTSDNCGTVVVTQSPLLGSVLSNHDTTQLITLTADDGNGNTTDSTFTITLKDVTNPVFTSSPSDSNVNVDALDCTFTIPDYAVLSSATDNCGTATITQSPAVGSIVSGHNTVQLITLTANDGNGNTTDATFTITLKDLTNPTISAVSDFDVDINVTDCDFTIPDYTSLVTSSDNCGTVTVTQSPIIGTVLSNHNTTQLITLTTDDGNGNTTDETFTITLKDATDPAISAVIDFDVNINATDCDFTIPDYTSFVTTSDNCGAVIVTQSPLLGSVLSNHNTTQLITLTADDGNGNTTNSTFTITLKDVTNPVFTSSPSDSNVNVDALDCSFTIPDYAVLSSATDNCGTTTITQSPAVGTIVSGHNTIQLITLTADDGNGNTTDATFTITLKDVTAPTISSVADFDVEINTTDCDFTIPDYTGLVTTSDNCGTVTVTQSPIGTTLSNHNTAQLITLTADDGNGNSNTSTFTITLKDVTLPTITTNGDFNVDNDPGQCGASVTVSATASDNCTSPITPSGLRSDFPLTIFDEYPVGTTTITWSVSDANGNSATTTQTVTVNDVEDPVFASLFPDLTVNNDPGLCSYETSQLPVPGVSDNCTPFSGVVTVDPATIPVSAGPDHLPSIVTWTATDNAGNTVTATQNVTVQDLELPVMRTKDITLYYDANGQIIITPQDIDDGSTDNSGTDCFTKYVVPNIIYCGDKGDNSVILTGTDLWGNQHYKEATVTAVDNTNPTISALGAITLNTNTGCTWVGTLVSPTTADNCSVVSVTNDAPAALLLGDTTVTWTVTDASGNTATTTQVVTVIDVEKPIAIAKVGVVVELDTNGDAGISYLDIDNGSTDNCGIDTITVSPEDFDCLNVGANVVTLTVTDDSGNVSTIDTVVTVVDNLIPVIASVSPIVVNNSAGICGANITVVAPLATDNCTDGTAVGTRSDGKLLTDVYPLGSTIITWNFADASGNVALAVTQTVDVSDNEDPTITVTPITVDTNAGCIWTGTLGLPVTADNCSVVSVTSDRAADFAYPVGNTNVVWTVTDAAGNSETATQTVTVTDVEKPIAKASDITIKLSSTVGAGAATITVAQVNNGSSDNCGIRTIDGLVISKSSFDCTNVGANTVVLTVTDISGNVSTANAIVTVVDDVLPVIASVTAIAVNTSTGICGANLAVTPSATATDNCTVSTPVGTRSDAKALTAVYPLGRTIITWNVKDANGNAALPVIQTVDVTDAQVPVITTNGNKTANVDANSCAAIVNVAATATDNCTVGTPTGVRSDAKPLAAVYPVGTTTITWNVTDVNGNAAVAVVQTVVVTDNIIPVITANGNKNFVSDFGQCGAIVVVSATATDNCSVTNPVIGTRSDAAAINALYPVGTTTITWNVTDVNNNPATPVVQTVTVRDLQIPVINGTVVSIDANTDANACGATVTVTPPTASDNCSVVAPVGTRSDNLALTALYPIGTTTISWKVTDVNGNVALPTTTTVKVKDATAPTVITKPITIALNVSGVVSIVPADVNNGSNDACGIASYSLDRTSFSCSDTGAAKTVTLTVIDIHGNVASATALVTVTEPIIPIALTRNITVQLNAAGTVSILPSDINNGSTDNCSIVSFSLSKSTFDCSNVGQNIITLTATDASGNNSIPVNATVTVQDKIAPVVVTQPFTAQLDATGNVAITVANVNNGSTDACGIATYSLSKATFTCANVGSNVITLTATDVNGNVNQAFATVLVVDSVKPVVLAKDIELVLDGISVSITPEDVFVSATDACGVDVHSYTLSRDTFTIVDVLNSPVTVTLSVTDVNGNVGTDDFLITFPRVPAVANEVITPNGDGTNDTWVIDNITNHPDSIVKVYNTWGSLVFSATNYQNNWDGKLNGNDVTLPDGGSYYYQIDLDGNGSVEEQGWLYITRQ